MDHHDGITRIETFGVEQIPDHERHATPFDLFRLIFGGANTFATAALGRAPILFGRSFTAEGAGHRSWGPGRRHPGLPGPAPVVFGTGRRIRSGRRTATLARRGRLRSR